MYSEYSCKKWKDCTFTLTNSSTVIAVDWSQTYDYSIMDKLDPKIIFLDCTYMIILLHNTLGNIF